MTNNVPSQQLPCGPILPSYSSYSFAAAATTATNGFPFSAAVNMNPATVPLAGVDIASTNPILRWCSSGLGNSTKTTTSRRGLSFFPRIFHQVLRHTRNPFVPNVAVLKDDTPATGTDGDSSGTDSSTARAWWSVDYSDNDSQAEILQHHYWTELFSHKDHRITSWNHWNKEMLKDYAGDDTIIYEVLDGIPATYRGPRGIRQMLQHDCHIMPTTSATMTTSDYHVVELQHVAVNQNHAQVIWKGHDLQSQTSIIGTDSFTFDEDNHIVKQTVVAMTSPTSTL